MPTPALSPAPPTRPPLLHLVAPTVCAEPAQPFLPLGEPDAPVTLHVGVSPEVEQAARSIARALGEALAGRRPVMQVRPVLGTRVGVLVDHLIGARVAAGARLAGVRVSSPDPAVAEVTLILSGADASGAVALRVERRRGRWLVTALEAALGPGARRPARA